VTLQRLITLGIILALLAFGASSSVYTLQETEQAIITEFGKPVGNPVSNAGLHFKVPVTQEVNRISQQILAWDGQRSEMPTRDKLYISVDMFARWRITQPLEYFRRLRDERSAQSRLDDILGSETRTSVAKHDLIEVIRTTKGRKPKLDETLGVPASGPGNIGVLQDVSKGRTAIEREIRDAAKVKLAELGIELLDVRFKRINYNPSVVEKIYERMISERQQIASRFRSEGEGEAAKIMGERERDLSVIESEAYKKVQEVRGQADAKATSIYAAAYSTTPDARSLYAFIKSMDTYRKVISENDTLVLSSGSDLYRFLNDASGK
jgi:membrane protease subunit HflC